MERERAVAHFSYDNPVSLLRSVIVLLRAQGILIDSLVIDPQTVHTIITDETFRFIENPLEVSASTDELPKVMPALRICDIPFRQEVVVRQ